MTSKHPLWAQEGWEIFREVKNFIDRDSVRVWKWRWKLPSENFIESIMYGPAQYIEFSDSASELPTERD